MRLEGLLLIENEMVEHKQMHIHMHIHMHRQYTPPFQNCNRSSSFSSDSHHTTGPRTATTARLDGREGVRLVPCGVERPHPHDSDSHSVMMGHEMGKRERF